MFSRFSRLFRSSRRTPARPHRAAPGWPQALGAVLDRVAARLRDWLAQRLPRPLMGLRRAPVLVPVRRDGVAPERKVQRRRALY